MNLQPFIRGSLFRLWLGTLPLWVGACGLSSSAPSLTYEVVGTYPTDATAYTQGLLYHEGHLYESTGLYGASSLRQVELETGRIVRRRMLPPHYFGEGLALYSNRLYQLTWVEEVVLVYDADTLAFQGTFPFQGEGWGITTLNHELVVSDGTDQLRFYDPATMRMKRRVRVSERGQPVSNLNELEAIRGQIFAHVFMTDDLVRIDPVSGDVTARLSFPDLHPPTERKNLDDVFNGIAYDAERDRIFVTGKQWPKLFEIRLVERP